MPKLTDLTQPALDRAIFFDFEMREADETPALIGMLCEDDFQQVALDSQLHTAAEYTNNKEDDSRVYTANPHEYLADLINRAESEDRLLIAYTNHEKDILNEMFSIRSESRLFVEELDHLYLNANAKRWFKRNYPAECETALQVEQARLVQAGQLPPSGRVTLGLKPLLRMPIVNYESANHVGIGSPAKAIAYVRSHSRPLTTAAKRKWSNLLTYNAHDVIGMKHLLQFIINHR